MATVQMNVRIDEELKAAGDRVFASLGQSSTSVVRSVWAFASKNADSPDAVRRLLESMQAPMRSQIEENTRAWRESRAQADAYYEEFLKAVGAPGFESDAETSNELLRERAYAENLLSGEGEV